MKSIQASYSVARLISFVAVPGAKGDDGGYPDVGRRSGKPNYPLILCQEEDVEGNQRYVGKLDDSVLYYFKLGESRTRADHGQSQDRRCLRPDPTGNGTEAGRRVSGKIRMRQFKEDFPLLRQSDLVYLDSAATLRDQMQCRRQTGIL